MFTYGPFGELGTTGVPRFGFTGQQFLAGLDLYDYKARFYSPALGRFLQADPLGLQAGMNSYAYVANDPLNRIDPNGLLGFGLQGGGGGDVGLVYGAGGQVQWGAGLFYDWSGKKG
ncbi:MAG: RHS repeat-associated core domain-containing protein [Betaproteobacteria bacterium]|nr:RHS repeat-associated core domain-containing protein [Betaproteobacteria bacterium]